MKNISFLFRVNFFLLALGRRIASPPLKGKWLILKSRQLSNIDGIIAIFLFIEHQTDHAKLQDKVQLLFVIYR